MARLDCEVLVVGSGPGGAMTSSLLAEAGFDVLMVEEGRHHSVDSSKSYTLDEMNQKYRNGGLTSTLGNVNVTYIEGKCVGGASEINAALYHRPLAETLETWRRDFQIDDFEVQDLMDHFETIEGELGVSTRPMGESPASQLFARGAKTLGWKSREIQRFWKYSKTPEGGWRSRRQSMTETLIPRSLAGGTRLETGVRVHRIRFQGEHALYAEAERTTEDGRKQRLRIGFNKLFVCAGAVQTPLVLRRSGVTHGVGDTLQMHPMIRFAARFPEPMNDPAWGVPVHQVEQFKPAITLGCSHSSIPHVAMWMNRLVPDKVARLEEWPNMGVFYVAVAGKGMGKVRPLPVFKHPLVRHPVLPEDLHLLGEGLSRLAEVVFAAGATEVYSPFEHGETITHPSAWSDLSQTLPSDQISVSTIHLFSSLPMGEDLARCTVDSHGKLHGKKNVWIQDASVLPTSPGVNPQGTILTLVRRNVQRFLDQHAG